LINLYTNIAFSIFHASGEINKENACKSYDNSIKSLDVISDTYQIVITIRAVQRVQDPFKPPESDRPEAQRVGLKPLAGRVRFLLSGNPNIRFGLRVKGLKTRTNRPDRSFKRKKKFWSRADHVNWRGVDW